MLKNIIRIAIGTALFLLIPLVLTLTGSGVDGDGFHWTWEDFIFAFVLIFGTGSLFELVRQKAKNSAYKFAAGLALAATFLLIWINGAVGLIGDSDANVMYGGVVITLFIGTIIARLKPHGMSYVLFAAALVQFLIPIIALIIGTPDFSPGVVHVFMLNFFWVMMFVGSALLFRQAAVTQPVTKAVY